MDVALAVALNSEREVYFALESADGTLAQISILSRAALGCGQEDLGGRECDVSYER